MSWSDDRTIRLWDAATGAELCKCWTEANSPDVAWSADGRGVMIKGWDRLQIENVALNLPVLTGYYSTMDGSYAIGCPLCQTWSEIPESALGSELSCPNCSERVRQ